MPALSAHFRPPPGTRSPPPLLCLRLPGCLRFPGWEPGDSGLGHPSAWAGIDAISQESCPTQGVFLGLSQFLFLAPSNKLLHGLMRNESRGVPNSPQKSGISPRSNTCDLLVDKVLGRWHWQVVALNLFFSPLYGETCSIQLGAVVSLRRQSA